MRTVAADNVQEAEELFSKAQAKRQAGDEAAACKLFRDSLAKNPNAVGTILNVALCDEKAGKLAAAYHRFEDARDRAREQDLGEHQKAAEQHLADLGNKIGTVTIALVDDVTPTLQIDIDGQAAKDGENIVDPGSHTVRVIELKRQPYTTTVSVKAGERKAVAIPHLEKPHRGSKAIAKLATFGGTALVATAVGLGLVALHRYNGAFDSGDCIKGSPSRCNAEGYDQTKSARQLGTTATIVGGLGLVTAGLGVVLWLRF